MRSRKGFFLTVDSIGTDLLDGFMRHGLVEDVLHPNYREDGDGWFFSAPASDWGLVSDLTDLAECVACHPAYKDLPVALMVWDMQEVDR